MAEVGNLVMRHGKWMTLAPTHCPKGHKLGPGRVLVGHVACGGHGGGGHTIWHCVVCPDEEAPTFGPPLAKHCTVLAGAASVSSFAPDVPPPPTPEPPWT